MYVYVCVGFTVDQGAQDVVIIERTFLKSEMDLEPSGYEERKGKEGEKGEGNK